MRKLRLLIAEDDRALANILRIVLQEEGFEVTHCRDGRIAIQTLTEMRDKGALPDIILLDLNMPHVTGWEVAAWLDADPRLGEIPVIVISATEAHGKAAKALHVDAYLVKPFTTDEIIGVVSLFTVLLTRHD
ncbi:MAG: response regulator [Chloroflexi bacterium CFX4]|nr:response regulator [Chloroflexi bacterium CFX4]MDL1922128.1 response regulator [Chloroflexi bacterium CFX3]